MEFGSLKYGLPRRSAPRNDVLCLPAPRNDVNYCNPELLVLTSLRAPAPRYTSLRAPEGGVAIYNNNITLYYLSFFCI